MNDRSAQMRELIEKSSLGTRSARAARNSVSVKQGRAIARATLTNSAHSRSKDRSIKGSADPRHL